MKRRTIIIFGILAVLFAAFVAVYYYFNPLTPKIQIGNQVITLELAITDQEKMQGLSGRNPLPENHGMMFVYTEKNRYQFWMKDMKFALDFIWIDDTKVADLTRNVPYPNPGEYPPIIQPNAPVNRVLEMNAGTIDRLGIKIGDTVTFLRR